MFGSVGASIYRPLKATSSRCKPWQIAAAVSLGVMAGLLLSNSLLGFVVLGLLFMLPIHFLLAALVALLTAGLLWTIEPALGQFGSWSLSHPAMADFVFRANGFPLVPWLRLNNTVVHGAILVGLVQLIPTFWASWKIAVQLHQEYEAEHPQDWARIDEAHAQMPRPRISFIPQPETLTDAEQAAAKLSVSESDEETQESHVVVSAPAAQTPADNASSDESEEQSVDTIPFCRVYPGADDGASTTAAEAAVSEGNSLEHTDVHLGGDASESKDVPLLPQNAELSSRDVEPAMSVEAKASAISQDTASDLETDLEQRVQEAMQEADEDAALNINDVAKRASELASLVDEMISAIQEEEVRPRQGETSTDPSKQESSSSLKIPLNPDYAAGLAPFELNAPSQEKRGVGPVLPGQPNPSSRSNGASVTPLANAGKSAVTLEEVAQHEEALRYLLHHLKEIKNRV